MTERPNDWRDRPSDRSETSASSDGRRSGAKASHAGLAERLSADLALPATPTAAADESAFATDPAHPPGTGFPQSIASGDPSSTGVVLWTRLDPERYAPEKPVGVEMAADETFSDLVFRGVVSDSEIVTAHDHTLKVDLDSHLDPDSLYYYRFTHDGYGSRIGRCRTLPERGTEIDSLSLAVVTCQDYQNGYYGAYAHVADEEIDFLIHVGDFVYESAAGQFAGRSEDFPDRVVTLPSGHDHAWGLEDYRYLYRTYKTDRLCGRALRRHTMIACRDDHEVANDLYWDYNTDAPGGDHPLGDDREEMRRLTAEAIGAWWEYMPTRVEYDPDERDLHERFRLWRSFPFGDLVDLVVTDERLFRSAPRDGLPTGRAVAPENECPERTMLGDEQLAWFTEEIGTSEALWTVWCDEVLTVPFRVGAGRASLYPVPGSWDGYARERREIAAAVERADVSNFVTLTGDMHCYIVSYKQAEYRDAIETRRHGPVPEGKRLGVEFMTPAMTSVTVAEGLGLGGTRFETPVGELVSRAVRAQNPHIDFFDSHHNGYSVVEFTRESCSYTAYAVDKTENTMDAEREVLVAYEVPEGRVALQDVTAQKRAELDGTGRSNRQDGIDRPAASRRDGAAPGRTDRSAGE